MIGITRARQVGRWINSLDVLCAVLVVALLSQGSLGRLVDIPAVRTGATVFVAVCVQAMPFLVLGVLVSGLIAAFVSPLALRRVLPRTTVAAVPVAGLAGMALPGCECASVPVARRLMQQGIPPAAPATIWSLRRASWCSAGLPPRCSMSWCPHRG